MVYEYLENDCVQKLRAHNNKLLFMFQFVLPIWIIVMSGLLPILIYYSIYSIIVVFLMLLIIIFYSYYYIFKIEKLVYKSWFPARIFIKFKDLLINPLIAIILGVSLFLFIIYSFVGFIFELFFRLLINVVTYIVGFVIIILFAKKIEKKNLFSNLKYFKQDKSKLEDIFHTIMKNKKLEYKFQERRSIWQLEPPYYYIEKLKTKVYINKIKSKRSIIRFDTVNKSNIKDIIDIQHQIDILFNLA